MNGEWLGWHMLILGYVQFYSHRLLKYLDVPHLGHLFLVGELAEPNSSDSRRYASIDPAHQDFPYLETLLGKHGQNVGSGDLRWDVMELKIVLKAPLDFGELSFPGMLSEEQAGVDDVGKIREAEAFVTRVLPVFGDIDFLHVTELTHELS